MKLLILSACLLLSNGRPQMGGFNPGTDSGRTGSGSGYNAGSESEGGENSGFNPGEGGQFNPHIPDFVPDDSAVHYPDESGGDSGFNAGNSGSGFNPHIPDFVPDESITNPGGRGGSSGFNPGTGGSASLQTSNRPDSTTGGSGFNPGRTGGSGFNPGNNANNGFNPGSPGSAAPGFGGFKTPIIFAEDNEVDEDEKKIKPVEEAEEEEVRVILLQQVPFFPRLETSPGNSFIAAQTLPSGVQFAGVPTGPYVPGTNKQQYLRGRQQTRPAQGVQTFPAPIITPHTRPFPRRPAPADSAPVSADSTLVSLLTAANPVTGGATAQTLPSPIVFAPSERELYVPGTNKQQYLRGPDKQTKPFPAEEQTEVQYVPLIQVRSNVPVQTLPSQIVFEEGYVPGSNKQQYVRGGPQTKPFIAQYAPLIKTGVAQTLPSPITFEEGYVPGSNKLQYTKGGPQTKPFNPQFVPLIKAGVAQTLPSPITFNEGYVPGSNKQQYVRGGPLVRAGGAQALPSPITWSQEEQAPISVRAPYVPGTNKQQYLRSGAQEEPVSAYPGVSARPSFPPGYYPSLGFGRMIPGESQVAFEGQQGPKNVLYFF